MTNDAATDPPLLQVDAITKTFGGFTALDNISVDIRKGERFGLIGPNGSGKTTLINCISGALMCAAGAPAAMYLQFADPASAFNLNYSVSALAMSLIGGTSHWLGPVLGAILLATTQQLLTVTISSEINVLVLGIMLVLFVVGAPKGIIGLLRPRYRLRAGGKHDK